MGEVRPTITLYQQKGDFTMPRAGTDFKYRVKFVAHQQTSKGELTRFSIADKLKGTADKYQNYSFTVWDFVDIQDGDSVKILTIDGVEANFKNGKVYVNLSGTVIVIPQEAREPQPEQAAEQQEYQEPQTDENGEFVLPFDI